MEIKMNGNFDETTVMEMEIVWSWSMQTVNPHFFGQKIFTNNSEVILNLKMRTPKMGETLIKNCKRGSK